MWELFYKNIRFIHETLWEIKISINRNHILSKILKNDFINKDLYSMSHINVFYDHNVSISLYPVKYAAILLVWIKIHFRKMATMVLNTKFKNVQSLA